MKNAKEMFENIGMELHSPTYLLFEFNDERNTYVYFDPKDKSVESTYYIQDFNSKDELKIFKKAIDKFLNELGWLDEEIQTKKN